MLCLSLLIVFPRCVLSTAYLLLLCLSLLPVVSPGACLLCWSSVMSSALLVLLQSANNWWPPAGRSATGLLPAAVQVFVNDMESPKYLHWLGAACLILASHWLAPAPPGSTNQVRGAAGVRGRGYHLQTQQT